MRLRNPFSAIIALRRVFLLACGAVLVFCSQSSAKTLDLSDYVMTFDENFTSMDITAYGPGSRWIAHTPWNGDFGDAAFANPGPDGPFSINANGLAITARKNADGKWRSGLICSVDRDGEGQHGFTQKYGYFEMSAILPTGPGTWPAFWLVGKNKTNSSAEIDVIEYYGKFDQLFHSVEHVWSTGPNALGQDHVTKVPAGSLSSKYNTFGVLITPETTSFYLNRQEFWSTPTPPEYNQPMYILANLALGGGWPINDLKSPQVMQIKYIRAYQKKTLYTENNGNH